MYVLTKYVCGLCMYNRIMYTWNRVQILSGVGRVVLLMLFLQVVLKNAVQLLNDVTSDS